MNYAFGHMAPQPKATVSARNDHWLEQHPTPLAEIEIACNTAIDRLGYEDVEVEREADRIRYRGRTVGGEPVDIRIIARGPKRTDLRIRIGVFGDETTSRLVLEEIHQSL